MEQIDSNAPVVNPGKPQNSPVIGIGEWVITLLIMAIPLVNIVMLLVWGFSRETNPSKANWAKAALIWMAIGIVLYLLLFSTIMAVIMKTGYCPRF